MYQGDAAAPPCARLPVCLQHGGVGVGGVAEEAQPGQPQEHLGSVSPLHSTLYTVHSTLSTLYTVHCTLYHALQDVLLSPGARYHEAAPVLPAAAEPDLGHENVQSMSQTVWWECCQHRVTGQGMVHQRLGGLHHGDVVFRGQPQPRPVPPHRLVRSPPLVQADQHKHCNLSS